MTKTEKSWILYDVANSAFVLIITTTIMPIFYKDVVAVGVDAAVSTSNWGFANSLTSLAVAFSAPILGVFADYRYFKKRFLGGFLLTGLLFTLLLTSIDPKEGLLCLVFYGIARYGFAGANIFYDAFLLDVTSRDRMDWVSSWGYAAGYIGGVIPFLAVIAVVMLTGDGKGISAGPAHISFVIVAAWWLLLSLPLLLKVEQQHYTEPPENPMREGFARFIETFREIRKHKSAFLFLLAYFFYIDGVNTIITMSGAYGRDIGMGATTLILVILMIQVVAFPFTLLYGKMAGRYSVKSLVLFGIFIYSLISIGSFMLPGLPSREMKVYGFWILAFFIATSLGGIQALSRSYFGKLIPPKRSAEFFGFYNVFGKFAAIAGPFLMGAVGRAAGHSRYGVLSVVILFIIGGGILYFVKDPGTAEEGMF